MNTQDMLKTAKAEPYWFQTDEGPRRSISVRWPETKINGKTYGYIHAHQEQYWCNVWEDGEDAHRKALSWSAGWNISTDYQSALTDKARALARDAAQAMLEQVTDEQWHAALVEFHRKRVADAQEEVEKAQAELRTEQDKLAEVEQGVRVA